MDESKCPSCGSAKEKEHWPWCGKHPYVLNRIKPVVLDPKPVLGGAKFDGGKPRFSLLRFGCARALLGVAKVLTFGAKKYAAHSWRDVDNGIDRYWSAYERHANRIAIYGLDSRDLNENGEVDENHSGELDIDHMNTNGLFLAELIRKQHGIKD